MVVGSSGAEVGAPRGPGGIPSSSVAVDPAYAMELALRLEVQRGRLLDSWFTSAAAGGSEEEEEEVCRGGTDEGVCAFLLYEGLRWLRTGDSEDEPAWREPLLHSHARKVEDMRKILRILRMARTPGSCKAGGGAGYGDYYVDHQMPDTVPCEKRTSTIGIWAKKFVLNNKCPATGAK